ncbi:hypothetical protein V1520DRAFT_7579 [Lipomyces starkeyi]|uniref:Mid2 domain-containing protein n=1 Tax=Lipomyces starkeyi NRRL Y-11557 TaxID=675824 RepID=A0A1E3Q7G2_LIPST|nr:hypothetical protein LIPSTDRAFT_70558 [Lipomyces starkeyi NRRL Y-11557]
MYFILILRTSILLWSILSLPSVARASSIVKKQDVVHSNSTLGNTVTTFRTPVSTSTTSEFTISDVSGVPGSETTALTVPVSESSGSSSQTSSTEQTRTVPSTSADPVTTTASISSETAHVTTIFVTVSGSAIPKATSTILSSSISSSLSTASPTPTFASSSTNNSANGSSLSSSQKRIVIGVVVGVGGTIVLGILAYIFYRVWLRKSGTDAGRTSAIGTAGLAMIEEEDTADPFRSNLDRYHQPNQAANF